MSDTSKLVLKASLPRTSDLSFVGRFHHNHGFENNLFGYLLDQKELWGDKLFQFSESEFRQWVADGRHQTRHVENVETQFPAVQGIDVPRAQFMESFPLIPSMSIDFARSGNVNNVSLNPGDTADLREISGRNAVAIHVGGVITAMKWAPFTPEPTLAIAVMHSEKDLSELTIDPALSLFTTTTDSLIRTSIQFWKYAPSPGSLTLWSALDTSLYGATKELVWRPLKPASGSFGVISGVFTNGSLHFFNIPTESTFIQVKEPSWTVAIHDLSDGERQVPITTFDYITEHKVLIGTLSGSIAEYALPGNEPYAPDVKEPSFVDFIADSAIKAVTVTESNGSHVVLVNTSTTQAYAFQYEQMRQSRVETNFTILNLRPLSHRAYRIFVYPDSAESIGYTFVRHPHQKHSLLLKTELVSSFHLSEYLLHPLMIIGNVNGDVFVVNVGRKIFGVPKAHNRLVVPLKLWSISKTEDAFHVNCDYLHVAADNNDSKFSFTPPEVVISSTAMNETLEGSSCYAFGTFSGLAVIERLDTSFE